MFAIKTHKINQITMNETIKKEVSNLQNNYIELTTLYKIQKEKYENDPVIKKLNKIVDCKGFFDNTSEEVQKNISNKYDEKIKQYCISENQEIQKQLKELYSEIINISSQFLPYTKDKIEELYTHYKTKEKVLDLFLKLDVNTI